jgi:small subunit ribosomal protein S17
MFPDHVQHLVHDPNNSLVTGDVVELHRLRVSRRVEHVVASIVSPFGTPIDSRPPIPTADERLAEYKEYRFKKLHRRELRLKAAEGDAEAIQELKSMGLDAGQGAVAGVGRKDNLQQGKAKTSAEGAILGQKGQKLPQRVLPGGVQEKPRTEQWSEEKRAAHREQRRLAREKAAEPEAES